MAGRKAKSRRTTKKIKRKPPPRKVMKKTALAPSKPIPKRSARPKAKPTPKRRGRPKPSFQKKAARSVVKTVKRIDRKAATSQLKAFRRAVRILQRKGIVSKSIKVKTAKPTAKLKKAVVDFKPVIQGKATVQKITTPAWRKAYKDLGRTIKGKFVILDNKTDHSYSVDHRGIKTSRLEGRYETIELPKSGKSVAKFLHELEYGKHLDLLKTPREKFAFRFYGNNSRQIFNSMAKLVDYLSRYDVIDQNIAGGSRGRNRTEIIQAIEIVRVNARLTDETWRQQPNKRRDFKDANRAYKKKINATGRNESHAGRMKKGYFKKRWARIKANRPQQWQREKEAARSRMRKLRAKRKRSFKAKLSRLKKRKRKG